MASEPIRDPKSDHLLTPENSAFVIIDYQPVQVNSIASMDRQLLVNNIVGTAKAAVAYGLPIVPGEITDRRTFARAVTTGSAVTEFEAEGRAAEEIRALWAWIKDTLERK